MVLVIYSLVLNHHQIGVADELYKLLGGDFFFVETAECHDLKGGAIDYSERSYLIKAWKNHKDYSKAMNLAETADVCVFSGYEALPFEKVRMQRNLLSFDMGERMLKRGWLNLLSPRIFKMIFYYHRYFWAKKPLYKLCCSSFAKSDQYKLLSFKNKCYKWGYFIPVSKNNILEASDGKVRLMWCARFLKLKHPELVVKMARTLKNKGYNFVIDIYGDEGNAAKSEEVFSRVELESMVKALGVYDVISFHGNKPNKEILEAMKHHDIFLFTSDNREGWGAVVNEAMANGCAVVASDAIGSTGYLVKEKVTGCAYVNLNIDSLTEKVIWMLDHPEELLNMRKNSYHQMINVWNPQNASKCLLELIECLKNGKSSIIKDGPCSLA